MTRRSIFTLVSGVLACPAQTQTPDPFREQVIAFDKEWYKFKAKFFGCGADSYCDGPQSVDKRAFDKARGEAKKLFGLTESK